METKEVLIAARKLIEKPEDWWDGDHSGRTDTRLCAALAVWAIRKPTQGGKAAYDALVSVTGVEPGCLSDWNDAPGRTHAEVLAAFDEAIKAA